MHNFNIVLYIIDETDPTPIVMFYLPETIENI